MKLEELSIADLKALSDYAYKQWERSTEQNEVSDIHYWFQVDFDCRTELLKRITDIFKP